jgi:hypothetical protein
LLALAQAGAARAALQKAGQASGLARAAAAPQQEQAGLMAPTSLLAGTCLPPYIHRQPRTAPSLASLARRVALLLLGMAARYQPGASLQARERSACRLEVACHFRVAYPLEGDCAETCWRPFLATCPLWGERRWGSGSLPAPSSGRPALQAPANLRRALRLFYRNHLG